MLPFILITVSLKHGHGSYFQLDILLSQFEKNNGFSNLNTDVHTLMHAQTHSYKNTLTLHGSYELKANQRNGGNRIKATSFFLS